MDYPTLPIGFHWAPLGESWYTVSVRMHRFGKCPGGSFSPLLWPLSGAFQALQGPGSPRLLLRRLGLASIPHLNRGFWSVLASGRGVLLRCQTCEGSYRKNFKSAQVQLCQTALDQSKLSLQSLTLGSRTTSSDWAPPKRSTGRAVLPVPNGRSEGPGPVSLGGETASCAYCGLIHPDRSTGHAGFFGGVNLIELH